jgi:hypothetical protein
MFAHFSYYTTFEDVDEELLRPSFVRPEKRTRDLNSSQSGSESNARYNKINDQSRSNLSYDNRYRNDSDQEEVASVSSNSAREDSKSQQPAEVRKEITQNKKQPPETAAEVKQEESSDRAANTEEKSDRDEMIRMEAKRMALGRGQALKSYNGKKSLELVGAKMAFGCA